ncbi:MAG: small ribosomal subunit Rsm22 family protein [Bacteroides sp.]|nr:small ribosomal subunit Rsm22 family protein [Prevotella sp.]MCM1408807.1 small ribosomal subunit Rsm22 family protein [Treponema brennaborense]MCM1470587.1 small ribosomal subunit Rsm22 family protein [Bacteroides sp.]
MTFISSLSKKLPQESANIINSFESILNNIKPLNARQTAFLPKDIRELSHLLTDERPARRLGYMNETRFLSAYTRYFLWWNLLRVAPIFAGLSDNSFSFLKEEDCLLDLGSGPLTVPIALWLARPELREKKLTWYCVDYSHSALLFGEEIFLSVAAKTKQEPWRIVRIKGPAGTQIHKAVSFVSCANMFNELYWNSPRPLEETAKKSADMLTAYSEMPSGIKKDAAFFVLEPGIPRAARFVSLLRDSFIRRGANIEAPCLHMKECPMDGKKGKKWCHFIFSTENAPQKLLQLSQAAGLPKERAAFSFVLARFYASPANSQNMISSIETPHSNASMPVRIISDAIRLPIYKTARYACSEKGLCLVPEKQPPLYASGDAIEYNLFHADSGKQKHLPTDKKSGALILP